MPDAETIKSFNTALVEEFRANGGKVAGRYKGTNLLLLTTTGAKTGQPRITPLAYFRFDGKLVEVGTESFDATARELSAAQHEPLWTQVVATAPVSGEYQGRTHRVIPLFELQPHQG